VAGACATGTHGSGDRNAGLAAAVRGLELVTGRGDVVSLSRDERPDLVRAAAVGLGALGIVTRVTLDVGPAYDIAQRVYEGLPLDRLDGRFDEVMAGGYSVSLFTTWQAPRVDQIWVKRRVEDTSPSPVELLGAAPAAEARHPVPGMSAEHCTAQLGAAGPWHERLPHFRMEFTPSAGDELQTDYLVPRDRAWEALLAVASLRERVAPLLQVAEVRTVAADDLWLSPSHSVPCVSLHFTWRPDWPRVRTLLPALEERLMPLGARPHWGKLFTAPRDYVRAQYPQIDAFRALAVELDPDRRFGNAFLDEYLY